MSPVRVLQVVAQMNRGGVETWLMQVLRHLDPRQVRMDFLVTRGEPGHYDAEIAALGSTTIPCETPSHPPRFARRFLRVLAERGPYDVVHSHVHHFSGFVLALAWTAGVPVRIAHSHSDTREVDGTGSLPRQLYLGLMRSALDRFATHGLAVSEVTAEALFGGAWRADPRWRVARCGLDFGAFAGALDRAEVRAELGLSPDALVLGHVGRFDPLKNHEKLLQIAACTLAREPRTRLVLVGDGPLRAQVEADAARLGLRDRVVFAGLRGDVARVLRAFDVFVFPSVREGLPLVGLEAQAAGLPIVLADSITREVMVMPELFTWLSTAEPPEAWAEAALSAARLRAPASSAAAALEASDFSLTRALPALLDVYASRA
ncbi:MAG TPA: glycosyltransferase [Myxococcales bacterium]|jgi:glycosyltransferase involved in cell wall biosynthesis